ncbi:MAG: site-2 protease family protein [Dehalococcoidaceae bacterium]|nr:site-2 protease family protein [Dehalococcoidaceae bacterium]
MKSSIRLFKVGGIEIGVHYSWLFIFALITWSLAEGYFPQLYPDWTTGVYWWTSVLAALLLFISVLIHELAHSLIARARGMSVSSITLFLLGGVSNLDSEPEKPRVEFSMAIAGPATSLILAGVFRGISYLVPDQQSPVYAMVAYLSLVNLIVAIFNMLPGFPLDGGRVLRSILWGITGSIRRATNIAANIGRLFGWALIIFGFFQLFAGNILGGIWIAFIGFFLSNAAESSRFQVNLKERLSKIKVEQVITREVNFVSPDTTVEQLIDGVFREQYGRALPVCEDKKLLGIVTVSDVKGLSRDKWKDTPVRDIYTSQPLHTVKPGDSLYTAFNLINSRDVNQLLVEREGECAGIISRSDILKKLELMQELGT